MSIHMKLTLEQTNMDSTTPIFTSPIIKSTLNILG